MWTKLVFLKLTNDVTISDYIKTVEKQPITLLYFVCPFLI